jgi:hypothetical protein
VNRQEIPVKALKKTSKTARIGQGRLPQLQNLSNWPARMFATAILKNMAIDKRIRVVFYALATLEMILLSAFYAWGRVAQ